MNHEEFLAICNGSLGAPARGWQKAVCEKAGRLGHSLSQPTISLLYNKGEHDPNKKVTAGVARIFRALQEAIASGDMEAGVGPQTQTSNVVVNATGQVVYKDPDDDKTDDELIEEMKLSRETFDECVEQVVCGTRKSVLVSGPPGCGKSHIVRKYEDHANGLYKPVTGAITAPELFKLLYQIKDGGVAAFDDCDSIFSDEESLNLLKGALNPTSKGESNFISWLKMTKGMNDEDGAPIEKTFDFQGRILFMTNIDFERAIARGTKISKHLEALMDRSGYMTLGLHSRRRRLLWVEYVSRNSSIMEDNGVEDEATKEEILAFIREHMKSWRNLSLRLIPQLANYRLNVPMKWERHAKSLLMKSK